MFAADKGHVAVIRILVEQWVAEAGPEAQDASGRTVLMWAARGGDVEMVRFLLDNGADIHAQDASSRTVLMYAGLGGPMWRWCGFWSKTMPTSTPKMLLAGRS